MKDYSTINFIEGIKSNKIGRHLLTTETIFHNHTSNKNQLIQFRVQMPPHYFLTSKKWECL